MIGQLILGALFEEILLRGYILQALLNNSKNIYLPLIISSIAFSLLHLVNVINGYVNNPLDIFLMFLETFVAGLYLGAIYINSKSWISCTILHLIHNVSVCFVALFQPISIVNVYINNNSMGALIFNNYLTYIKIAVLFIGTIIIIGNYNNKSKSQPNIIL